MARLITKQPWEEFKINFDFGPSLGDLAVGRSIIAINEISISPTGVNGDLDFGLPNSWALSGVTVQVPATGGREGINYKVSCRVTLDNGWKLELDGVVVVEG